MPGRQRKTEPPPGYGVHRPQPEETATPRATWNGTVIADSDDCVTVEGNCYFPLADVKRECLRESATRTTCPWKGEASYYDVVVGSQRNRDAAWTYLNPLPAAREITGRVAFWRGVKIE